MPEQQEIHFDGDYLFGRELTEWKPNHETLYAMRELEEGGGLLYRDLEELWADLEF